ncbi:MAG: nucleotide exchange factor GrpE, partial [Treponema sp.]|nr:nucleotide exchange factor GrpE [Treponema sp.]
MSKHAPHEQKQDGENPGPVSGSERPEGPGPEAALNGAVPGERAELKDPAGGPEAAQGSGDSPDRKIAELEARLAKSEAELAESQDQYLRKAADFENFRKRIIREKQDAIDFANQSLLLDLIPVLDDFDRALESAGALAGQSEEKAPDCKGQAAGEGPCKDLKGFYEGVGMIARRLSSTLETKWGLKSYVSAGEPFDPNRHEALMVEKSAGLTEQTVQQDLLKGYALKDRVIRSAKVKVLVP